MKREIIKISKDLEKGLITTAKAKALLLGLFKVSGSLFEDEKDIDILHCKKCGSTDIYGDFRHLRCGDCGEDYH